MIIAISIIVGVMLYAASVGLAESYFRHSLPGLCPNCSKGETYYLHSRSETLEPGEGHTEAIGCAIFWPLTLPYVLSRTLGNAEYKRGQQNIKNYWSEQERLMAEKKLADLERKLELRS